MMNYKLYTHPPTHESLHTHTLFAHLLSERLDEGEKEENPDDLYDLMVRLNEPTWRRHLAQSDSNVALLLVIL